MADGSLIFDTKLDSKGLSNGLKGIGSITGSAMKGIVAGVGVATTAIAGLTCVAVNAYGDYEQLTGGVETLFKTSGDKVMEYANNAYKSAGMSANEYMETVTSFSASLIASLDGDTAKATEKADQAIVQMSDNANKMGSSMESIQNAYMGFAKQNYTMLDNLKLGYGGTKEEMQRLLEDATALSGVKYDISSYADIVDAIKVVQDNLGITGTTAKEASSTIQGSCGQMKAAWENFLVGMADPDQNFDELLNNLIDSVITFADNLIPRIVTTAPRLVEGLSQLITNLASQLPGILQALLPPILQGAEQIVQSVIESFPQLLTVFQSIVPMIVDSIITLLPQLIKTGLEIIVALSSGLTEALPELIPTIVDVVLQIVETLIDNIDMLVDAAIEMMIALAEGLINAIPIILDKAPTIINKLVDAIVRNAPKLLKASFEVMVQLMNGIIKNLPKMVDAGRKIVEKIIDTIKGVIHKFPEIGRNMIQGLINGVNSMVGNLREAVSSIATNALDTIKKKLGIHSPSREFAWIGRMCLEGFDNEMKDFDPYDTFEKTVKANKGTLDMSYQAGLELNGNGQYVDYDRYADANVRAFEKAGLKVVVDGRQFGRVVRGCVS